MRPASLRSRNRRSLMAAPLPAPSRPHAGALPAGPIRVAGSGMGVARPDLRNRFAEGFRQAEHLLYLIVGVTLAVAGFVLFGYVIYRFGHDVVVGRHDLAKSLLDAVD